MLSNHPNIHTTAMRSQIESNREFSFRRTPSKSSTVMQGPGQTITMPLGLLQAHDGCTKFNQETRVRLNRLRDKYTVGRVWSFNKGFLPQPGYDPSNIRSDRNKYIERDASGQCFFKMPALTRGYMVPNVAEWTDMTILRAHTPHTWLQLEERRGSDPLNQIQASKRLASEAFDDEVGEDVGGEILIDDGGMNRRATAKKQRTNSEQDLLWDNQNSIHVFACKDFTQHLKPEEMTLQHSVQRWAPITGITGHGGNHSVSDVTIEINTFRKQ